MKAAEVAADMHELDDDGPDPERVADFEPFPVRALPEIVADFVRETAGAIGCDPAFVAMPALAVQGAAIGTTRVIELKPGWTEPAVIWDCVVASSGAVKTPPFEKAIEPLIRAQTEALAEHRTAMDEFDTKLLCYERDLAAWKRTKGGGEPPGKPTRPEPRRYVVADATVEAIAPILEQNPRGLLLARDEFSGWIRGFNQYKGGRGGDVASWLEMWRAGMLNVDRKTGDRRIIHVPRAAVSVCGTIQPGVLKAVLTTELFESGLAARLLLARPPDRPKRWTNRVASRATIERYHFVVRELLKLEHTTAGRGPEPARLPLTADALKLWIRWDNRHGQRTFYAADDARAAALAKLEAYAARFALNRHAGR